MSTKEFKIGDCVKTTSGLIGKVVEKFGDHYKVTGQDGREKFTAIFGTNYLELVQNDGFIYYDPEDEVAYRNFESFKEAVAQFGAVKFGNTHCIYFDSWLDSWFGDRDYAPSEIFLLSDTAEEALLDEYFDYVVNEYWNENMIEIKLY